MHALPPHYCHDHVIQLDHGMSIANAAEVASQIVRSPSTRIQSPFGTQTQIVPFVKTMSAPDQDKSGNDP